MSYIREICFLNRDQRKAFKAVFVLYVYATRSFGPPKATSPYVVDAPAVL
jgi:hypothetical protein